MCVIIDMKPVCNSSNGKKTWLKPGKTFFVQNNLGFSISEQVLKSKGDKSDSFFSNFCEAHILSLIGGLS